MASRRHRRKQQRQRRQARFVKRVEFILSSDGEQADRDRAIFEHLAALTARGEASEWIKATLYAALVGTHAPVRPQEARHDSIESDAVLALAREVKRLQELVAEHGRPVSAGTHERPMPTSADQPAEQVSSGIDMSGPRRHRGELKRSSPPAAELTYANVPSENPALVLAASIRMASAQLAGHA